MVMSVPVFSQPQLQIAILVSSGTDLQGYEDILVGCETLRLSRRGKYQLKLISRTDILNSIWDFSRKNCLCSFVI